MSKFYINTFSLNTNDLGVVGETRQITVRGDVGAEYSLQVVKDSNNFYNFKTNSFSTGFSPKKNKKIKLFGSSSSTNVVFPGGSSAQYKVLLFVEPNSDTELIIGEDSKIATKSITQNADVDVVFSPVTVSAVDGTANYKTLPSNVTKTAIPNSVQGVTADINMTFENAETTGGGFGFRTNLIDAFTPVSFNPTKFNFEKFWYFEATEAILTNPAGDGNSTTTVVVASLTDLVVGMELFYKQGTTSAATNTSITAINTTTKTITLSVANTLTEGQTMTFRGYGSKIIEKASGTVLSIGSFQILETPLVKTVRAAVSSSTTITVNGTFGIAGGNHVIYKGQGVDNSSNNAVTSVSASSSAGSFESQTAQTLLAGASLKFNGCTQKIQIIGQITIIQFPSEDRTISLDLEKFITVGANA
jgi:hypothetical protein